MKYIKSISVFLALCLIFSFFLFAQEKEQEKKKENEKARVLLVNAKKMIYQKDWEKAVEALKSLVENYQKSGYLDDSLYWLGYSMYKLSANLENVEKQLEIKQEALEKLNYLINQYTLSSWVDDAKVLRIELAKELYKKGLSEYKRYINESLKGLEGVEGLEGLEEVEGVEGLEDLHSKKETDPELELKLVALNALLSMDQEEAFPILVKIVNEDKNPKLRERALFVLCQSKHPDVIPILIKLATRDPDDRVKERAITYLGMREEGLDALLDAYNVNLALKLKHRIIISISMNKSKKALDKLLDIAKNDKDQEARERAITMISVRGDKETKNKIVDLYDSISDPKLKDRLIIVIGQIKSKKAIKIFQ